MRGELWTASRLRRSDQLKLNRTAGSMSQDLSDSVQGQSWEGRDWSEWHSLDEASIARRAKAPALPGLYRIRCHGQRGLIYIGETGRSLLSRFRQLQIAMNYARMAKYARIGRIGGPPHVAGGCVWKHKCAGFEIDVSWTTTLLLDARDRKGTECELIAAYRKEMRSNPSCQFSGDFESDEPLLDAPSSTFDDIQR